MGGLDNLRSILARRAKVARIFPMCGERYVHGVRLWLPPDAWPAETSDDSKGLSYGDEIGFGRLAACIGMVMAAMADIEGGKSPMWEAPSLHYDEVNLEKDQGRCWVWGLNRLSDGTFDEISLPVYALDYAAGWALTLHGIFWFGGDQHFELPTVVETVEAEPNMPPAPHAGQAP